MSEGVGLGAETGANVREGVRRVLSAAVVGVREVLSAAVMGDWGGLISFLAVGAYSKKGQ